jgi:DNA-binding transcriptional LysR family regulator
MFADERPGVRISIDIRDRETVFHHVARSVAEIGMVLEFRDHPNLTGVPLHLGEMVCVVRETHPLAQTDVIRISDLRGIKVIRLERSTVLGDLIDRAVSNLGEPLNWSIETRYCATACALVQQGEPLAIVDEYSTRYALTPGFVVKRIIPPIPITPFIVYAGDRPLSKLAKLMVAQIKAVLTEDL